jgi:hypothetical protein
MRKGKDPEPQPMFNLINNVKMVQLVALPTPLLTDIFLYMAKGTP